MCGILARHIVTSGNCITFCVWYFGYGTVLLCASYFRKEEQCGNVMHIMRFVAIEEKTGTAAEIMVISFNYAFGFVSIQYLHTSV